MGGEHSARGQRRDSGMREVCKTEELCLKTHYQLLQT